MAIWNGLIELLASLLRSLHDVAVPVVGGAAWGWGIVLLTIVVRVFLLPLAIKQTRSMREMQKLQPEMKKIQSKFKVERSLMRSNPEKYREQKTKQQEAMMALYKEHNVNPAASCLPLLLQMPIFFALYRVLLDPVRLPELQEASFYFFGGLSSAPGTMQFPDALGSFALIALMGATTFLSQKQMMARTPGQQQMQQQKILLYVMPIMLMVFGYNLPIGVLLYWVTTNLWTMGQQWVMFRNVEAERAPEAPEAEAAPPKGASSKKRPSSGQVKAQGSGRAQGAGQSGKRKQSPGQKSKRRA